MSRHPFDLAEIVHGDLVLADVLIGRLLTGQGSPTMLAADLITSLSAHVAASDAVLAAAVAEQLAPADDISAAIADDNGQISDALVALEEDDQGGVATAVAVLKDRCGRQLAEFGPDGAGEPELLRQLRSALGDDGMVALGREFIDAKRQAPSRPHPRSHSAIFRIVGVIDRVRDASSGRAVLATTDGSGILNAESQDLVNAFAELGPKPIELLDPDQARRQPAMIDAVNRILVDRGEDVLPAHVESVLDTTIETDAGEVSLRIYNAAPNDAAPNDAAPNDSILKPVVIYVHGGGWVLADIYAYDASPRAVALLVDAVVVSVEYRRAPEHPFPAAHDDVAAALRWLQLHADQFGGDPQRIAVVGESAGATMVAAACLNQIRTDGALPLAQVLISPLTSTRRDWPSCREHVDAKPLNTAMLGWFAAHLLADGASADDRLDLLAAPDADLARMPPTLVITAERDPLHDQGVAFADRLKSVGVAAALREYNGVPHEFFGLGRVLADARDAQAAAASLLTSAFAERA